MEAESVNLFVDSCFVEVCLASGRIILGIVKESEIEDWRQGRKRALIINHPQALHPMQGSDGHVKIAIVPSHITDTKQNSLYVCPEDLEILGNVTEDGTTCSESNSLYQNYLSALDNRRAALAGIVAPTAANKDNVINMSKLPKPRG